MTLIQEPVGLSLSAEDLTQMFDRSISCTYSGVVGEHPETCDAEATHRLYNHDCGHSETMCEPHARRCARDGLICDIDGGDDDYPEVFPL